MNKRKNPPSADADAGEQPQQQAHAEPALALGVLQKLFSTANTSGDAGTVRVHSRLIVGATAVLRVLQKRPDVVEAVLTCTKASLSLELGPPPRLRTKCCATGTHRLCYLTGRTP
jgi:hypothetical protein